MIKSTEVNHFNHGAALFEMIDEKHHHSKNNFQKISLLPGNPIEKKKTIASRTHPHTAEPADIDRAGRYGRSHCLFFLIFLYFDSIFAFREWGRIR